MSETENPYITLYFFAGCAGVIGLTYLYVHFSDGSSTPEHYEPTDGGNVNLG